MTKQLSFLVLFAWFFAVTNASSNNNHIKMIAATSTPTRMPILVLLVSAPYRWRSSSFVFSWLPFDPVENLNEIINLSVKIWSFILFAIWWLHNGVPVVSYIDFSCYFISFYILRAVIMNRLHYEDFIPIRWNSDSSLTSQWRLAEIQKTASRPLALLKPCSWCHHKIYYWL